MSAHLEIEFHDGTALGFDEPESRESLWWHGTSEREPGVFTVVISHDPREVEMFPLVSIRRLRVQQVVLS